jgi:hypothetical protein
VEWLLLGKRRVYLALAPDIAVVQECSKKSVDVLQGQGFSGLWFGANLNLGSSRLLQTQFMAQALGKPFGERALTRCPAWRAVPRISDDHVLGVRGGDRHLPRTRRVAKYYDFDKDFLLELEPCSTHYEMYDK